MGGLGIFDAVRENPLPVDDRVGVGQARGHLEQELVAGSEQGMLCRAAAADRRAVELTATQAGRQAMLAWQATNAAVLHLALSTLSARRRRALAAAAPALDALARAVDRLADSPGCLAEQQP